MPPILLSTAYLPPVQYMSMFLLSGTIFMEKHENFQKQSYRNRCYIYGANGRQCLVIPVIKHSGEKMPITGTEIDYNSPWQQIHMKSIESAYGNSPFYEFYADDFNAFYTQRVPFLFDWNFNLLNFILRLLGIQSILKMTEQYEKVPADMLDYRQSIHPKTRFTVPGNKFIPAPYQQVFLERFGFIPNLSVIDLIFNEGPNAGEILAGR